MAKNDEKIKELLSKLEEKKKTIGERPKHILVTNGIFKYNDKDHVNINTLNDLTECAKLYAFIKLHYQMFAESAKELDIVSGVSYTVCGYFKDDWKKDIQSRVELIKYNERKKELDMLEKKLNSLVSEELKTEVELDNISKLLG